MEVVKITDYWLGRISMFLEGSMFIYKSSLYFCLLSMGEFFKVVLCHGFQKEQNQTDKVFL